MAETKIIAHIIITPKPTTKDTQGEAKLEELTRRGCIGVQNVSVGKVIDIEFSGATKEHVECTVQEACEKFLANPVIEEFRFSLTQEITADTQTS